MVSINKLVVSINLNGQEIDLGELVRDNKKIYFKYFTKFIDTGLGVSPIKLPLSDQIFLADTTIFEGLYGLFNDSLPDGWGRLLLDRALTQKGISISRLGALDRLSYVGSRGMGALMYRPVIKSDTQIDPNIELDALAEDMRIVLEGSGSDVIEVLYELGGSSGGARPKIFINYNPASDHLVHGIDNVDKGYEPWIIKFPATYDRTDIATIEYAYYKMAIDAGIEMSPSKLFTGKSGRQYFGTKRFDRQGNKRVHMHSASGLMHDDFRQSTMDYGHLMDCAFKLENHVKAYEKVFRLAAFNVYAHNRDDHSKNFAFLMDHQGKWSFAPAYDLTFSSSSHGWHSTMVAGESQAPGRKHLMELAETFSIDKAENIITEVQNVLKEWVSYATQCKVTNESSKLIEGEIKRIRD